MKVLRGIDADNMVCGYSPNVTNKPLVYWCPDNVNPMVKFAAVCVASCPGDATSPQPFTTPLPTTLATSLAPALATSFPTPVATPPLQTSVGTTPAAPQVPRLLQGLQGYVTPGQTAQVASGLGIQGLSPRIPECARYTSLTVIPSSEKLLDRYCLPVQQTQAALQNINGSAVAATGAEQHFDQIEQAVDFAKGVTSIANAKWVLVSAFILSIVMGYVYLMLLRCCAKPLIWLTILITIVGFAGTGFYMFSNADDLQSQAINAATSQGITLPDNFGDNTALTSRIIGGILMALAGVTVLLVCCFHSSIDTAAAVVSVACECMWEMPLMLLLPLMKAVIKGAAFLLIMYGFILVYTTADPVQRTPYGVLRKFEHTDEQKGVIAGYTFTSLWVLCFLDAFYQFVVAYMVVDYYYSPYVDGEHEKDIHQFGAMAEGILLGLGKHSGSLAFGSLLIAIIMFLQKLVEYAEKKNKETANNQCVTCILGCIMCCLQCCKSIIEAINKNAYIDIAVDGTHNFCSAAKEALQVIVAEGSAMAILNGATFVFQIFGTLAITIGTGGIVYFWTTHGSYQEFVGEHSDGAVPDENAVVLLAMFLAFIVALVFMNIFDMTADTLIYCFGYDRLNRHISSTAPPELRELCSDAERQHGYDKYGS
jgi:hypothetical protein